MQDQRNKEDALLKLEILEKNCKKGAQICWQLKWGNSGSLILGSLIGRWNIIERNVAFGEGGCNR